MTNYHSKKKRSQRNSVKSNEDGNCESGRQPILNLKKIFNKIALKYYDRMKQLICNCVLYGVYEVDRSLFNEGHRSWYSFIDSSLRNLKLDENILDFNDISQQINEQHSVSVFFSLRIQITRILSLKLSVSISKDFTKLRISSHLF